MSSQTEHRKLAAIMFTDMVGYSTLAQTNEALALKLLEEHRRMVRGIMPRHSGREVKTTGDGFLIEFPSALAAVEAAVAVQQALHERNRAQPAERQVLIRVGIHLGDVVLQQGDIHGDGVNIAARIEPLAPPGGICVSNAVFEQVRNKLAHPLEALGPAELKNIKLPVVVHRVVLPWEAQSGGREHGEHSGAALRSQGLSRRAKSAAPNRLWIAAVILLVIGAGWWLTHRVGNAGKQAPSSSAAPAPSPGPVQKSVAVLPFVNMSAEKENEYFSDGVTEEILNALSRTPGLRVAARTSAFAFKGRNESVQRIGEALNVGAVLEGSVRKGGEQLRITAQLIKVADGFHLWSEEYDRDMTNIFAIQSDIATRVAEALKVQLLGATAQPKKPTENIEAYQLYLRGRQLWNRRSSLSLAEAAGLFSRAIETDTNFALAYAGLADCYVLPGYTNLTASESALRGRTAALKAIELDGALGEPHAALGMVQALHDWDWAGAEAQFRRATELNPNYATAHHWLGILYEIQGRCGEAIAELQRAQALDPLSSVINSRAGLTLCTCGAVDPGIQLLQAHLVLDPKWARARASLAVCYFQQGRIQEAIHELETARTQTSEPASELGFLYARAGRTNDALEVSRQISQNQQPGQPENVDLALIAYGLGDEAGALDLLEKAFEARENGLPWLAISPYWKQFRQDPRAQAILRKMNLPK